MTDSRQRIWPRGAGAQTRSSFLRRLIRSLLILATLFISISAAAFLTWQGTASYSLVRATYAVITQDEAAFYQYVDLKSILRFAMEDFKAIAAESSHTEVTNATAEELVTIKRLASSPEAISREIEERLNVYFHAPSVPGKTFEIPVLGKVEGKFIIPLAMAGFLAISSERIEFVKISDRVTRLSIEHYVERVDRNLVFDIEFEKRPGSPWIMTRWTSLESNLRTLFFSPLRTEGKARARKLQWKGAPISFQPISFLKTILWFIIALALIKRLRIYRTSPNQAEEPHYQVGLAFRGKEFLMDVKSGDRRDPQANQLGKAAEVKQRSSNVTPPGIKIIQSVNKTEIVREWLSPMAWIYLVISGIFFVHLMIFTLTAPFLVLIVFPAPIITGALIYRTATLFFNRTTIDVSSQSVKVRHHPLPWLGNRTIASGDLRQVYCFEKSVGTRSKTQYKVTVNAIMKNGKTIRLVAGGIDQEQALFIAEIIQTRLLLKPHHIK